MAKVCFLILACLSFVVCGQSTFQVLVDNVPGSPAFNTFSITETSDGNIYAVGSISPDGWATKCRLIKFDPYGNLIWDTIYSHTSGHEFYPEIMPTPHNGVILASDSYSYPISDEDSLEDILVWEISATGTILWQQVLSARNFYDFIITENGDYVFVGTIHETKPNQGLDIVVYRLDSLGNIRYSKRFGQQKIDSPWHSETCVSVKEIDQTTYVTGYHNFDSPLYLDGILYALDSIGNKIWDIYMPHTPENDKIRINSVFKFNHRYYFSSIGLYEFDPATGNFWTVPYPDVFVAVGVATTGYNYAISCGINDIGWFAPSSGTFRKYSNLAEPYYELVMTEVFGTIGEMIATNDGGYLIITNTSQQMQITKTDCMGNIAFWSEECNSKIPVDYDILIYPNPSQNEVLIEATFDFNEVVIYTINGDFYKYLNPCCCPRMTLDISDFSSGVYVVRISNSEQNSVSRFIKI